MWLLRAVYASATPKVDSSESTPPTQTPFRITQPVEEPINLAEYVSIIVDTTRQLTNEQLLLSSEPRTQTPLIAFAFEEKYTRGKYAYWLRYRITNELAAPIQVGIDLGVFDSVQTYVYAHDTLVHKAYCGTRVAIAEIDGTAQRVTTYFRTTLAAGQSYLFLSRITNEIEINRKFSPLIVPPLAHESRVLSRFTALFSLQSAFLAILLIVFLINFFQFAVNKEPAYLYYSLYVLVIMLFFSRDFYCTSPIALLDISPICRNSLLSPLVTANLILYALFVISFLETKRKQPLLHQTLLISIVSCLVYFLVERVINHWNPYLAWKLYGYFKIVILITNLAVIFMVTRIKNPLSFFVLSGTSILLLSAIITALLSFRPVHFVDYLDVTYIPQYLGIVLELLLFSIGMGYKTKLTEYERRKATAELSLKQLEVEHEKELWSVRANFYTQITHEFRTPLTVILGMTDAVRSVVKDQFADHIHRPLDLIKRSGKNLLQLVNEMLDLAKVESGNMALHPINANIVPYIKYLCESLQSLANESGITLTVYAEVDEIVMDFDAQKVQTIVSNLVSNAIKFTEADGQVIVHLNRVVKDQQEILFIRVKDSGSGIPEEVIPHIFDLFYQVDSSSSCPRRGSGVGLALTKEFVDLMGGTIRVRSTLGEGSEFTVWTPVTQQASPVGDVPLPEVPSWEVAHPDSSLAAPLPDCRAELPLALIIEDNSDVAYYIRTCLQQKYRVMLAMDGFTGLEIAYEHIPDVIICDVMMPGIDGFQVCATLKTDDRTDHIPIVILTARVTHQDRLTGLSHGADAYLTKPFSKAELFTRLDQLVLLRKKMLTRLGKENHGQLQHQKEARPEAKFVRRAIKIIQEDIDNHELSARLLAHRLHLSESQIYRKLKAVTGKSTALFIRSVRLQKAKELVQTTDKTMAEVAYAVGFNDPSWFSRAFKEEFGSTPSAIAK